MKTGHSKFKSGWGLLFLSGFLLTGCVESFYFFQWQSPPSSYVEPAPKKTAEEKQNSFFRIDCRGGVTCYVPDEEKTDRKEGLVIKECLWKNASYKNGPPGLVWLTFSQKGDGCWQLHREQNEESKEENKKSDK
jgi:hypothetical protein